MKNAFTTTTIAVVLGLTAAGAFAADSNARTNLWETSGYKLQPNTSTVSRAQVNGEVMAAVQARTGLSVKETSSHFAQSAPSVLSRAEVKADLLQANKAGNVFAVDYRG